MSVPGAGIITMILRSAGAPFVSESSYDVIQSDVHRGPASYVALAFVGVRKENKPIRRWMSRLR